MIITPTGYGPVTIEPVDAQLTSTQKIGGDKRQVRVELFVSLSSARMALYYDTQWESERCFCWLLTGSGLSLSEQIERLAQAAREQAKHMLPPGAGYPATPSFETRQARLRGLLETATLVGLSDVLTRWYRLQG